MVMSTFLQSWADESPWWPSIQLVMWNAEGAVPRARISPGIIIDQTNITVLILVSFFSYAPAHFYFPSMWTM